MLRRLPTSRLVLLVALVFAVLAGGTALAAGALRGSGPKPPAKPLAVALHDALAAKPVAGVTARIRFANRLIDSSSVGAAARRCSSGAKGRLWAAPDGRFRLELQSDAGDAQITGDGRTVSVYDATTNSGYRVTLPQDAADAGSAGPPRRPDGRRDHPLPRSRDGPADLSGARPSTVAGRPAYTVRIAPKHDGGLIGAAELAWDAQSGTPLRAAVYASGAGEARPGAHGDRHLLREGRRGRARRDAPRGAKMTTVDLGDAATGPGGRTGRPSAARPPSRPACRSGLSAPARSSGSPGTRCASSARARTPARS